MFLDFNLKLYHYRDPTPRRQCPKSIIRSLLINYINNNKLVSLPDLFGKLRNLRTLEMNNNLLSELPESFISLKNLKNLQLYKNKLVRLPESFGNLKNIQTVHLEFNKITSLPSSLENFTGVELNFYRNPLSDKDLFEKIKRLKERGNKVFI